MEVMKLLTVFALGMLELWAAIPAGLALRLHPIVVGITAAGGATAGAVIVVLFGERLRTWLLHGRGQESSRKYERVYRLWARYGVPGLGLLAPLLTGAMLGAALGLSLGVPARRLLAWMSLGIGLWSAALTLAGALGWAGIQSLAH